MDDDRLFFDWVRHYALTVGVFLVVGLLAGVVATRLVPARFEAWSVAVQAGDDILPRDLGPTALAIVRSAEVYEPAMREAGVDVSAERFFEEFAELRPVPETDALIMIGRSEDPQQALAISDAMVRSLIRAFEGRALADMELFSVATPVEDEVSAPVIVVIGLVSGLWLGLALALIHYRLRRPVMTLERAMALLEASSVTMVEGPARWRRLLRRVPGRMQAHPAREALVGAAAGGGGGSSEAGGAEAFTTVVAHAGTSESEIAEWRILAENDPRMRGGADLRLIWMR